MGLLFLWKLLQVLFVMMLLLLGYMLHLPADVSTDDVDAFTTGAEYCC